MKESGNSNNTTQKAYWIVGISLIIFLILLAGSLIGLKITRDGLNNINNNVGDLISGNQDGVIPENYEEWDDGTKQNISKGVVEAEFNFDGLRISHCSIIERQDGFSEVSLDVENMTEQNLGEKTFLIKLYDANNTLITEFTMLTNDLASRTPTHVRTMIMESCVDAEKIEVELVNVANNNVSGE